MYIKHFLCNHVLFLIIHDGYPVKAMKNKENAASFFQVILGSERITGRKEREIKISKFRFLYFCFYLYNIMNSFPVIYCTRKAVYFLA